MSSENTVKAAGIVFGTAGTQTVLQTTAGTATSNPYPMPRQDFTIQVGVGTTGTSGVGATVIWQGSNDSANWINVSSCTATASQAGTGTSVASSAMAIAQTRFAYGRAQPTVTGTGSASVWMGS